jgi:hypothetical protein
MYPRSSSSASIIAVYSVNPGNFSPSIFSAGGAHTTLRTGGRGGQRPGRAGAVERQADGPGRMGCLGQLPPPSIHTVPTTGATEAAAAVTTAEARRQQSASRRPSRRAQHPPDYPNHALRGPQTQQLLNHLGQRATCVQMLQRAFLLCISAL